LKAYDAARFFDFSDDGAKVSSVFLFKGVEIDSILNAPTKAKV